MLDKKITTLGDVVKRNAGLFGDKVALSVPGDIPITFGAFADHVRCLVNALYALGLTKGTRVAILSRNRAEYLEAVCVCSGGLIALPLNWRLSADEIASIIKDSEPDAIIADAEFAAVIDESLSTSIKIRHRICFDGGRDGWIDYQELTATDAPDVDADVHPDDTACLVYTSGTTGKPKGAELTHRGLLLNCKATVEELLQLTPSDVGLTPMPLFHVGGLWYHLFPSFAAGCTTWILPAFDAPYVLKLIAERGVTHMHVVPTMLHALISQPDIVDYDTSSLRLIFYAASSIPPTVLKGAMTAFNRSGFVQSYGSTEAGMVTFLSPQDHREAISSPASEHLLASCGRPFSNVEVKLSGAENEISVRSPMTMARYWRNPDVTSATIVGGWLSTGDLGYVDGDGYYYIYDRRSDLIVSGGENVYPREVEEMLLLHPDLIEVAVFDVPDEKWVQKVAAAVVTRAGTQPTTGEIIEFAKARLAHFKCPKVVFVVDTLPRNGAGKVLRKELRRTFPAM